MHTRMFPMTKNHKRTHFSHIQLTHNASDHSYTIKHFSCSDVLKQWFSIDLAIEPKSFFTQYKITALSFYLFINLFICLCVCLSVYLFHKDLGGGAVIKTNKHKNNSGTIVHIMCDHTRVILQKNSK